MVDARDVDAWIDQDHARNASCVESGEQPAVASLRVKLAACEQTIAVLRTGAENGNSGREQQSPDQPELCDGPRSTGASREARSHMRRL